MSMKDWKQKVLAEPGAAERVAEIEDELRLAAGLTQRRAGCPDLTEFRRTRQRAS